VQLGRYLIRAKIGAGLPASWRAVVAPANAINFAPHIAVPKLLVQGRYDEDTPVRTAAEPLFKLLVEPKQMVLFEGGHVPSIETQMSIMSGWLDDHLGPVVR
jgi:pimeloyl-ACP methyl ester carboxylesterase